MRLIVTSTALLALLSLSGCGNDAICGSDDYPVKLVGSTTGRACVAKGEQPPAGYVRYPAGQEPRHVGDKWDVYWDDKRLDESGRVVGG